MFYSMRFPLHLALAYKLGKKMIKDINGVGIIVGAITWIGLVWWMANEIECSRFNSCDGGDMVSISVISLGMLVPAWVVTILVSSMFKK